MSDDIIDLGEYLRRREGEAPPASTFALWGAEGERSRFALPLWRCIYLASGERGAILYRDRAGGPLHPFVVLDLAEDPPRIEFSAEHVGRLGGGDPPEVLDGPTGSLAVFLGDRGDRRWFLVVAGSAEVRGGELATHDREDILFLAGECAGLLFLRDFADESGNGE